MDEAAALGRVVDGRIVLAGPADATVRIVPPQGVRMLVVGVEAEGPLDWQAGLPVPSVAFHSPQERPPFTVALTEDGRRAFLSIHPTVAYRLIDCPSQNPLHLQVAAEPQIPTVTPEDVRSALTAQGVRSGIREDILEDLTAYLPEGRIVIAQEIPPQPGESGRIEILFQGVQHHLMEERGDGSVAWRTTLDIPMMHAGDVLAQRIPPGPGKPGLTLLGETIPPPAGRDALLMAGKGVELAAEGNVARATQDGLPRAIPLGPLHVRLEVDSAYVHQGNVNLATGNLHFADDLVIHGSLEPGATVSSEGRILIDGQAERAAIEGGRGIRVAGNVFSSTLTSGKRAAFHVTLLPLLEELLQQVETVASQLASDPPPLYTDRLRSVLLAQSPGLPKLLIEAAQHIQGASFPLDPAIQEQEAVLVHLTRIVTEALRQPHAEVDWDSDLADRLRNLTETVSALAQAPATITVHAIQGCTIISGGDVLIEQAAFNSQVVAGGKVEVQGTVRGGSIRGARGIAVREAGSPKASETLLETAADGEIRLLTCWPGVEIRLGSLRHHFETHATNIRARLVKGSLDLG